MSVYQWSVRAFRDAAGKWGATWETAERAFNPASAPKVSGNVDPVFDQESDAKGHAMMWIARYEDALANPGTPVEVSDPRPVSDDDLAEALAAHQARFKGGDVRLGNG